MATINYLTRVELDHGIAGKLPEFCAEFGMTRPLLIGDQGLVAAGVVAKISALFDSELAQFMDTPPNPTEEAVLEALKVFKANDCDGIIALGGGSPIDLAKGVRLMASHEGPLAQYAAVEGGVARIQNNMCPLIAVPTTAGTGSEVGRAAVLKMADGRKLGVLSPYFFPSLAVCDPDLTLGLPPMLTAATGMDALSHCLETFMGAAANPPADAIALEGLSRGYAAIRVAVKDGQNKQARFDMMVAAFEGALAFQKGLGAVHALSHPLGAIDGLTLHHGTLNAVLMPAVLRFNRPVIGDKWERMAAILGGEPDEVMAALNADLGLPSRLSEMGVLEEHLPAVAAGAMKDHCHGTNPRSPTEAEYLALLKEAF